MSRALVTLQKIKDIHPIENADSLEVATVLGWNVVVRKDEFKVNDLVCFFEVDSFLPIHPVFSFMEKSGRKTQIVNGETREGYRLRTVKLRGTISQGLILSISDFLKLIPAVSNTVLSDLGLTGEGAEVTDLLGIVKYEPPIHSSLSGLVKGPFPSFIEKTDETRIQSVPQILEKYYNEPIVITEKLDGSSMTAYVQDGELNVCSRNLNLKEDDINAFWRMAHKLNLKTKLLPYSDDIVLQGELVGPGINGNRLKLDQIVFYLFNVYTIKYGRYYNPDELWDIAKELEIQTVPYLEQFNGYDGGWHVYDPVKENKRKNKGLIYSVDELVEIATRKSLINPSVWAEGIVVRSVREIYDLELGRLSFKVINPEYLLRHGE